MRLLMKHLRMKIGSAKMLVRSDTDDPASKRKHHDHRTSTAMPQTGKQLSGKIQCHTWTQ
jgi:hypothetical protein